MINAIMVYPNLILTHLKGGDKTIKPHDLSLSYKYCIGVLNVRDNNTGFYFR